MSTPRPAAAGTSLIATARRAALTVLAASVLLGATGAPEAAHELLDAPDVGSEACDDCEDAAELACSRTCASCACCAHLSALPGIVLPVPERASPSWRKRAASKDRLHASGYRASPFRPPAA